VENPRVSKKTKAILNLGAALNHQIDKNPSITDKSVIPDDINWKLDHLGLKVENPKLFHKYKDLNPFYNASKHQQRPENKAKLELLKKPIGIKITIDYFETVRRIFQWYYRKFANGLPDWDVLKPIKYTDYNINYRFTYNKRWI